MKRELRRLPLRRVAMLGILPPLGILGRNPSSAGAARLFVFLCIFALAVFLPGCANPSKASEEASGKAAETPQFSAKKGLILPETTRKSLGLKIVEVTEQSVSATLDLALRIYQVDNATVFASGFVNSAEAKRLKPGQAARVRSTETETIAGKISKISNDLEKAVGMVEVLVEIANPPTTFAIGGFLDSAVSLDAVDNVVTIPRAALLECSEGSFVYTVSGNSLVRTAVKVGVSNRDVVEVKDGLYSGDQVALQPVLSLWLTELAAVKGGQSCCIEPPKGK